MIRQHTAEYLRECFSYDEECGGLTWKHRPDHHFKSNRYSRAWNSSHAGKPAGTTMARGCVHLCVDHKKLLAHRVAWAIKTGSWPLKPIDHADRNPANNAFSNLRECTMQQNQFNRVANQSNKTGMKGVCWDKHNRKYMAKMCLSGRTINLGRYDTAEGAKAAYDAAAKDIHGDFAGVESRAA